MVEVKNVSKKYKTQDGEIVALDDVSLRLAEGDFVAVVGRSGSGKTTLLNMLAGLDKPDHGVVFFDGVNITALSEEKRALLRRGRIGVIYQFYNLIPVLNVTENITLPVLMDGKKVDKAYLDELVGLLSLNGREKHLPNELSGGQQQRVSIGRALINNPAVMLADEPTGNLDSKNSHEIVELLKLSNKKYGQTLIVITHDDTIALQADRIITINDGKIASDRLLQK